MRRRVLGIALAILIGAVAATTPLTVSAQRQPPPPSFITKERIYECGRPSAPPTVHNLYIMYTWWIRIRVTNTYGYPITGAEVKDRFGAEFGVAVDYVTPSKGTPVLTTKGNSEKVFPQWTIGTLALGESATLILEVWTDINPGGHREFTSYGCYYMNSGVVVKGFDIDGVKHSAETGTIKVSVTPLQDLGLEHCVIFSSFFWVDTSFQRSGGNNPSVRIRNIIAALSGIRNSPIEIQRKVMNNGWLMASG